MILGRWLFGTLDTVQFLRHLAWLRRSQWHPAERMRAFQEERLRYIIRHAYAHSPFYRRRFDAAGVRPEEIRTLDDLQRIPVLQRHDVAEHNTGITADNARRYRPESGSTSGTTGARLEFIRDRQAIIATRAANRRFEAWHGVPQRHRRAEVRNIRRSSTPIVYGRAGGGPRIFVNVGHPDLTPAIAAAALAEFDPEVVFAGSPTWLAFLSLYLLKHPEYVVRPRVVFATGERLFPDQRDLIGQAFSAHVVERYGLLEYVVAAGECGDGRLHIASEMGVVEILAAGRRCPPGETGEIVLTSLWNRAFPFIRYATGDLGHLELDRCPCGRGLPTWRVVGGRERDMVATPKGFMHMPGSITAEARWRGKIEGIRFLQETAHDLTAQVVRGPSFVDADAAALRAELTEHFRGLLDVSVEFCDSIEQTAGGKYRYVVSRVPLKI